MTIPSAPKVDPTLRVSTNLDVGASLSKPNFKKPKKKPTKKPAWDDDEEDGVNVAPPKIEPVIESKPVAQPLPIVKEDDDIPDFLKDTFDPPVVEEKPPA